MAATVATVMPFPTHTLPMRPSNTNGTAMTVLCVLNLHDVLWLLHAQARHQ